MYGHGSSNSFYFIRNTFSPSVFIVEHPCSFSEHSMLDRQNEQLDMS